MDIPKIEQLISKAIQNRPSAANAPLNLYVYNGRIVCGTRVVMPKNARFICHIAAETIIQGFNASQWKAVVEKTVWILKDVSGDNTDECDFKERRREERLKLTGPLWFTPQGRDSALQGQLVDVSSGGMAFNCYKNGCPATGNQITARFTVPWFSPQGNVQNRKFTRTAKVCRIGGGDSQLKRVAVQFDEPLPFKPAEQNQLAEAEISVINVVPD
ncbi:MAG: PilZ domain-containing protein [Sedimentisphaerales bacterium]|nr:PilZ domain-containing protein [Sedimentisphaerales bacterium]